MSKTSSATTVLAVSSGRMNVEKYLQTVSQPSYVAVLLRKFYGKEFHTVSEWNAIVTKLLATKTK